MSPRVTQKVMAKVAGVSVNTVSRALNDKPDVNPETKDKILRLAKEFRYTPNLLAKSLKIYRNEVMADYVRKMGKDLAHIHISDANRLPPGQGGKDFRPLLKALKETGFDGFLTQEIAFGSRSSDPDACALQGYEYLKSLHQEI